MKLHEFIAARQDRIIERCHAKLQRLNPDAVLDQLFVPLFIGRLVQQLTLGRSKQCNAFPTSRLNADVTPAQIADDYRDVCLTIAELAIEDCAHIQTQDFHAMDQCLDDTIAEVITDYIVVAQSQHRRLR